VLCVVAYGQLLRQAALALPRLYPLNAHASLLPKFRGAAPIQAAILAGELKRASVSCALERGLDTGPVLCAGVFRSDRATTPGRYTTAGRTVRRMLGRGAQTDRHGRGRMANPGQNPREYRAQVDQGNGRVDWTQPAAYLERLVRAMNPWPARGRRSAVQAGETRAECGWPRWR